MPAQCSWLRPNELLLLHAQARTALLTEMRNDGFV